MSEPTPRLGRRVGVIDIGSNSVRFVVYNIFGAAFFPTFNEKVLAGLGRGLRETGALSPEGKADTLAALKRFRHIVNARNLKPVLIGATAAMREATDGPAFQAEILRETGFDIAPISGPEEARLGANGVLAGDKRALGLACDLGGASLEITPVEETGAGQGVSLKLGPFQVVGDDLTSDFDSETARPEIASALADVDVELGEHRTLHLIGGAWRNLALIHQERTGYPLAVLQGYSLDPSELLAHCRWAYGPGRQEVLDWSGISSQRRETLPYGALALEELIKRYDPDEIRISVTGLREGLVVDHLGEIRRKRTPLIDGCRDLARGNLQAEGLAKPLGRFLAPIEDHLPKAFQPANEARLREAARHLAGMGRGLHPDHRAELVFENVLFAPLSGLLHPERAYLAHILHNSYTFGGTTSQEEAMDRLLKPEQRQAARIYGTAIRLGESTCGRAPELFDHVDLSWDKKPVLSTHIGYESLLGGKALYRLQQIGELLDETDEEFQGMAVAVSP